MAGKIRVMQVLEATVGGTRRHVLDLCLNLPADHFEQHLVCSTLRDARFAADIERLREAGVTVTVLPMRREIHPPSDWACYGALVRLIRGQRPQIVHGHSAKGGFLGRLAARRVSGVRTVYNPHAFAFQMDESPLKRALYQALERYAGRFTDRLVAVCPSQRELAVGRGIVPPERVVVVPSGVKASDFQVQVDRDTYRRELGIPEEARLVGTVGALTPQKGLEHLVRAAATVRREPLEAHFVIAGEGSLRGGLERLAKALGCAQTVHFLGHRPDIPELLAALDLFVLPSLWEGLPYALLEAGAAGVPIVATRVPGNLDLIRDGETGRLANPADALDLAVQIVEALGDENRAAMALRLQRIVEQEYTLERMTAGHAAVYQELVEEA